jgi:hypothetical protein
MGFFKDAPVIVAKELAPPTLEKRAEHAARRAKLAIDTFATVANDLESAAAELDAIASEAFDEAARLQDQAELAATAAGEHLARANRIRDLIA